MCQIETGVTLLSHAVHMRGLYENIYIVKKIENRLLCNQFCIEFEGDLMLIKRT